MTLRVHPSPSNHISFKEDNALNAIPPLFAPGSFRRLANGEESPLTRPRGRRRERARRRLPARRRRQMASKSNDDGDEEEEEKLPAEEEETSLIPRKFFPLQISSGQARLPLRPICPEECAVTPAFLPMLAGLTHALPALAMFPTGILGDQYFPSFMERFREEGVFLRGENGLGERLPVALAAVARAGSPLGL